jgi:thioredoxin-like negative regulator of GroEL
MDKITDKITTFVKTNYELIYISSTLIILISVLYLVMTRSRHCSDIHVTTHREPFVASGNEEEMGKKEPTKLVLFYATWCPHCKEVMDGEDSIWNRLKQRHGNRKDLLIDQIDSDKNPVMSTQYGIKGLPTILKIKGSKVTQFNGERTLENIEKFLEMD